MIFSIALSVFHFSFAVGAQFIASALPKRAINRAPTKMEVEHG